MTSFIRGGLYFPVFIHNRSVAREKVQLFLSGASIYHRNDWNDCSLINVRVLNLAEVCITEMWEKPERRYRAQNW